MGYLETVYLEENKFSLVLHGEGNGMISLNLYSNIDKPTAEMMAILDRSDLVNLSVAVKNALSYLN